ncbi:hypothetical protein K2173_022980 [Erythroxylum novogranatense]|uniref:Chalcone synthase n=1 Tax=Erythroxylum novogranatense TaxID=1862640 RepID=A0AAV8T7T0_9ROSI|nr:hypothetical protein K2173_022980 [Erythroxylum novogranatense]
MEPVEVTLELQRTGGEAMVLAIGTATPPNFIRQAEYPDFYFRVTKSDHLTQLKDKFKRICEKSTISKRYMHLTEDLIEKNPNIRTYNAPSLDARQEIVVSEVPKLGKEAALKAIEEWGQPISSITHLIFCTSTGIKMPGADFDLVKLLGLRLTVKRFMIYQQGCFAGSSALRLAKDIAENNSGARVLIVCSEIMAFCFHAPSDEYLDVLVGSALFGDGAAAAIVGANPDPKVERPWFQLLLADQKIIPNSEDAIAGHVREMGLAYYLSKGVPKFVGDNIAEYLLETCNQFGIEDWNSLFYVVHPGGPSIFSSLEEKLHLKKDKLRASRSVLREYGNMVGPSVLFVLDEMRRSSMEGRLLQGMDWILES